MGVGELTILTSYTAPSPIGIAMANMNHEKLMSMFSPMTLNSRAHIPHAMHLSICCVRMPCTLAYAKLFDGHGQ